MLIAASVAASGWPVLALWPGTKKPTHRGSETPNHGDHWLTSPVAVALSADEHDDREPPKEAIRGCPSYAAMTGQPSQSLDGVALVALDLDGDLDALAALLAEAGPDAEEWAADTLRVQRTDDRAHLWGTVPGDECPPTGDLAPGLEWRGSTGYAALPGSRHKSGALYEVTGGRYEFTDGGHPDGALYVGMADPDDADPVGLAAWVHPLPVPASLLDVVRERLGAGDNGEREHPARAGMTTDEAREFFAARAGGVGTGEAPASAPNLRGPRNRNRTSGPALARVLDALRDAGRLDRVRGAVATAHCPGPLHAHGDRRPGLSVTGVPGRVLVHCFAGCPTADVLAALGLRMGDLYDDDENGGGAVTLLHPVGEVTPEPADDASSGTARPPYRDLSALAGSGQMPERPLPEFLTRADGGLSLFYRGRVNRVFGRPENGKTWLPLAAGAELLREDVGAYAHVDLDHMGDEVVRRLALLGVPWDVIGDPARFRLYEPGDRRELADAVADLVAWVPDLAALDSVGELLPLVGANSNDPDHLSAANRHYVQPIADAGSGVVLLDHMAKYAGDGDGPTGTDAKGRPIRGASYHARTVRDFAPGQGGALRLTLDKDTTGSVRAVLADENARKVSGRRVAGVFALVPVGDDPDAWGSLRYRLDAAGPEDAAELASGAEVTDDRVTAAVVAYVTEHPGAASKEVEDHVKGKRREVIRDALTDADARGELTATKCGRGCSECARRRQSPHPKRVHYFPVEGSGDEAADDVAEGAE